MRQFAFTDIAVLRVSRGIMTILITPAITEDTIVLEAIDMLAVSWKAFNAVIVPAFADVSTNRERGP